MEQDPVPAFAALAHPQRLDVIRLLIRAHPDAVPAGEVGAALGLKPSTLSGYLAQLVEVGLIAQQRRGTSLLYTVSLTGIDALNATWIGDVCRGRGVPDTGVPGPRVRNLLFLGRQNAGPTLCAEALLRSLAGERYEVFSAGLCQPGTPDDAMMKLLKDNDLDTDLLWSKSFTDLIGPGAPRMDIVVAVGTQAWRALPSLSGCPVLIRWSLPGGLNALQMHDLLAERLVKFSALDPVTTTRARLQTALDAGNMATPKAEVQA
jgi:DNA-binding transcriptional ArsR family regulator